MAAPSTHISLYIPAALAESAPHAPSQHPCLDTLIARGTTTRSALQGDGQLLALFGGEATVASGRAAVSYFVRQGGGVEGWRIIASPVHLLADHATLHFPPQHNVRLSEEESRALMVSCQSHFAPEGWQLEYGDAQTWYLGLAEASAITTTPLADAVGAPLFEALPQGKDAQIWRRWLNEVQMLLHGHAVNQARQTQGEPAINSLWFWGEGRLPALAEKPYTRVYGGDAYVEGLARLSGAEWAPLPQALSALEGKELQGKILVVLDGAHDLVWESHWFCTLSERLRKGTFNALTLHFRNGYTTHLVKNNLWRFWRRKRFALESAS